MKKRLLISSVLMSAVLACALGTGTYAWYTAGGTGNVKAGENAVVGDISTITNPYTTGALTFTAKIEDASLPTNGLILTDENGVSKYRPYANATPVVDEDRSASNDRYGTYTVHVEVTMGEGSASLAEALDALGDTEYTVKVVGSKGIKVGDNAENAYKNTGLTYTIQGEDFTVNERKATADVTFYVAADGNTIEKTITDGTITASVVVE